MICVDDNIKKDVLLYFMNEFKLCILTYAGKCKPYNPAHACLR